MKTHHDIAADNQQQACANNSLRANPVRQKTEAELSDRIEQAISKDDVGQLNAAKPRNADEQWEDDAEIFAAKVKARISDPGNSKGLSLTDSQAHQVSNSFSPAQLAERLSCVRSV